MATDLLSGLAPATTALVASADATLDGSFDSPIHLSGATTDALARYTATDSGQWASQLPDSTVIALAGNASTPAPAAPPTPADVLFQSVLADPFNHEMFSNPPQGAAASGYAATPTSLVHAANTAVGASHFAPPTPNAPSMGPSQQAAWSSYGSGVGYQSDYTSAHGSGHGSGSGSGSGATSVSRLTAKASPSIGYGSGSGSGSGSGPSSGLFIWEATDPTNPTNWQLGDNWYVNGSPANNPPGASDDVEFDAVAGANADCNSGPLETVNSVTVSSNYSATITIQGGLEIGAGGFDFEGGTIIQAAQGAAIDVAGAFNWDNTVSGLAVLNAGAALSNVNANGPVTIAGANESTGSNLNYNGSVAFNSAGSLTFNNGSGINLSRTAYFSWNSTANIVATKTTGLITNSGGTFQKSAGSGATVSSDLPYVNNDKIATLNVDSGVLRFTSAGSTNGVSVLQTAGVIMLEDKVTLQVDKGLTMQDGALFATGVSTIGVGNVIVTGGIVELGGNDATIKLKCDGLVTMNGGTYDTDADLKANTASQWSSKLGFLLGGTATVKVNTIAFPTPLPLNTTLTIMTTPGANFITGDFHTQVVNIGATGKNYNAGPDTTSPKQNYNITTPAK
jgi:hypothetical protein